MQRIRREGCESVSVSVVGVPLLGFVSDADDTGGNVIHRMAAVGLFSGSPVFQVLMEMEYEAPAPRAVPNLPCVARLSAEPHVRTTVVAAESFGSGGVGGVGQALCVHSYEWVHQLLAARDRWYVMEYTYSLACLSAQPSAAIGDLLVEARGEAVPLFGSRRRAPRPRRVYEPSPNGLEAELFGFFEEATVDVSEDADADDDGASVASGDDLDTGEENDIVDNVGGGAHASVDELALSLDAELNHVAEEVGIVRLLREAQDEEDAPEQPNVADLEMSGGAAPAPAPAPDPGDAAVPATRRPHQDDVARACPPGCYMSRYDYGARKYWQGKLPRGKKCGGVNSCTRNFGEGAIHTEEEARSAVLDFLIAGMGAQSGG